ncbi:hypothetical protein LCGC14_0810370 [marine sediment metagenome]|uniref:Uncharacterized protein n=1 Tax=marine sediment metagenome TaxID=412755 RepID=A0A0F9SUE5_9ZZZZ
MAYPDPVTWTPLGLSFDVFAILAVLTVCAFFYLALRWMSEYLALFGSALIALTAYTVGLITWMVFLLIILTLVSLLVYTGYWQQRRR